MTSRLLSGESVHVDISNAESSEGASEKSFDYILKRPFRASELGSLILCLKHRITKRKQVSKQKSNLRPVDYTKSISPNRGQF
jgi:hypothetical protein